MTKPDHDSAALRLRHASTLLRIQSAREQVSRLQWLQASRVLAAALATQAEAQSRHDLHATAAEKRLHAAHDALRGLVVGLATLARVTELEQELAAEAAHIAGLQVKASAAVAECRTALTRADAAARLARRKQHHKQAIQARAALAWNHAMAALEEAEFESQAADAWAAASMAKQPASP